MFKEQEDIIQFYRKAETEWIRNKVQLSGNTEGIEVGFQEIKMRLVSMVPSFFLVIYSHTHTGMKEKSE